MARRRILWQIYPSYLLIAFFALVAVTWLASRALNQFYFDSTAETLETQARLALWHVGAGLSEPEDTGAVNQYCSIFSRITGSRITVIRADGKVIGESDHDPRHLENYANRLEVMTALAGEVGMATRYSTTVQRRMMYVAVPDLAGDSVLGVVRTSLPVTTVAQGLDEYRRQLLLGGLIVAVLAAALGLFVSGRISRPLTQLTRGAERFARGELTYKLPVPNTEELALLADAMNEMAGQLDERIRQIIRQGNEQEAILHSMIEGVLAVDSDQKLIIMNHAAGDLIGVAAIGQEGRSLPEVTRNIQLLDFVQRTLSSDEPIEGDLILTDRTDRYLQAHGNLLRDSRGVKYGALVVLNNVTRLRELEKIRTEFVANVSHELKTPITSIKGFVETLSDGAVDQPEDRARFLSIISKQTDRLNAIIDDLLSLSRIERQTERSQISLQPEPIRPVLESSAQACEIKAANRKVRLRLEATGDRQVIANARLLEQAVTNLIDNAIKYSEPEGAVTIGADDDGDYVVIRVADRGTGIAEEHLPRLFERFYRVDGSRSRALGGTGLGLAIVKHIVLAHQGEVSVESELGRGSTFYLRIPKADVVEDD